MRKKFDAVKFQRKIREELGSKYNTDREAFLNELKVKYAFWKKGDRHALQLTHHKLLKAKPEGFVCAANLAYRTHAGLNGSFVGDLCAVCLGYQTGPQAPGTDVNPSHGPLLYSLNPLEIWFPYLFCPVVGVADLVAHPSPFSTNFTDSCHYRNNLPRKIWLRSTIFTGALQDKSFLKKIESSDDR